jgi:hypothetical protein
MATKKYLFNIITFDFLKEIKFSAITKKNFTEMVAPITVYCLGNYAPQY